MSVNRDSETEVYHDPLNPRGLSEDSGEDNDDVPEEQMEEQGFGIELINDKNLKLSHLALLGKVPPAVSTSTASQPTLSPAPVALEQPTTSVDVEKTPTQAEETLTMKTLVRTPSQKHARILEPSVSHPAPVDIRPSTPESPRSSKLGRSPSVSHVETMAALNQLQIEMINLRIAHEKSVDVINQLSSICHDQGKEIGLLRSQIAVNATTCTETVSAVEKDLKERLRENLQIHKETPELTERLISATEALRSLLPKETQETVSRVELLPEEKKILESIKKKTAPLQKKLPKHAR
ncbi:hypothetical protein QKS76_gp5 [Cryphonectria parasitica sclerotimonavirus 1]|uniref:Uncharacterized protein n=1 Tax=Cryphonectria parasitica sclerotimonavirus 1 TaxID=2755404 RepID=A0AAE7IFC1_9MONO|nr:hypothetical protein QKS76_gp5 [Cryphonectria parasitica sclerotimonavirus 1]QMP84017.1 hypothetical protein [Cryphonectria parasitica sclerotimonavirus 1]